MPIIVRPSEIFLLFSKHDLTFFNNDIYIWWNDATNFDQIVMQQNSARLKLGINSLISEAYIKNFRQVLTS